MEERWPKSEGLISILEPLLTNSLLCDLVFSPLMKGRSHLFFIILTDYYNIETDSSPYQGEVDIRYPIFIGKRMDGGVELLFFLITP